MIIHDAQRDGALPLAVTREHLDRCVVKVEMPQGPHVFGFVAANFSALPSLASFTSATAFGPRASLANQTMRLHVPAHRGIGSQRPERIISLDERREIVVVQLVAPVLVCAVLPQ